MVKSIRILVLCIGVLLFINAADQAKSTPKWNRTEHNFGELQQGQLVETDFTCYNGDDTLIIENVDVSCGCTVPQWDRKPVMPHDSTIVKVRFNTEGKKGKHEKVIAVYTNQGLYELVIKANVVKK